MIEVLNYERENKKSIIGYVDIRLTIKGVSMIIEGITHFQSGDRRWFNLPTTAKFKQDGSKEYRRPWRFEVEMHNNQLLEALDEKVKAYCHANKIPEIEPLNFSEKISQASEDECPF